MLQVTPTIALDDREIQEEFIRAAGPGGQNVNKVATAVQLRFDVAHSPSLPDDVRDRLTRLAGRRLSTSGVLTIEARRYRTQARNRQDALNRLADLIRRAAEPPKPRVKTAPTRASVRRRLATKRHRSQVKQLRQSPPSDE